MGNIFGTVALEAAYSKGEDWLDQLLEYLTGNIDLLNGFIQSNLPGIRMNPPEATYLAWLDMRDLGIDKKYLRKFMI